MTDSKEKLESEYPECDKLLAAQERSQACGDFIEWLRDEKKLVLCEQIPRRGLPTVYRPAFNITTEQILAEFFGIDSKKLEKERRAMLGALREGKHP